MPNPAKGKGTRAETAVVKYMRQEIFPYAERRALAGNKDLGDTTGHPGLVFEVKALANISYPGVLRQTEVERKNAGADYGILVHKPINVGFTHMDKWFAVMGSSEFMALIAQGNATQLVHEVRHSTRGLDLRKALKDAQMVGPIVNPITICSVVSVKTNTLLPDYYVLYLKDMFTLLKRAGYGTLPGVEGS